MIWLPDSPLQESFLKGRERFIALSRVKENMTGVENRVRISSPATYDRATHKHLQEFKWYHVREALTDYKTYALFFFFLCMNVPTGGLVTFAAQIVNGLGYSRLQTVLLGMPTGVIQTAAGLMVAAPQHFLKNKRCITAACCCLIPLVCSVLMQRMFPKLDAPEKLNVITDELPQISKMTTRTEDSWLTTSSTSSGALTVLVRDHPSNAGEPLE